MKKSDFIHLIKSPSAIEGQHAIDLQSILAEFPYFTSAQLLLTKAFQKAENINFENQVKVSAAYAIDRRKLHDYLFEEDHNSSISLPEEETKKEFESETELTQEKPIENEFEPIKESIIDEKETAKKEIDPLNQQIISSAISSSIILEVDDQIPEFHSKENIEEKEESQIKVAENTNFNESEKHSFSS